LIRLPTKKKAPALPEILQTAEAQRDLRRIAAYTTRRWGARQAHSYAYRLQQTLERLARLPRLGRPCPELAPGLRRHEVASHVLFYRETETGIRLIRILASPSLPAEILSQATPESNPPETDLEKI